MLKLYKTRFDGIVYGSPCKGLWRIFDMEGAPAAVGPHYASRAELLSDIATFVESHGFIRNPS